MVPLKFMQLWGVNKSEYGSSAGLFGLVTAPIIPGQTVNNIIIHTNILFNCFEDSRGVGLSQSYILARKFHAYSSLHKEGQCKLTRPLITYWTVFNFQE